MRLQFVSHIYEISFAYCGNTVEIHHLFDVYLQWQTYILNGYCMKLLIAYKYFCERGIILYFKRIFCVFQDIKVTAYVCTTTRISSLLYAAFHEIKTGVLVGSLRLYRK